LGWAAVVEEAVGERTAEALVKEDKEHSDAGSFVGDTIGVAAAVALEQSVGFHLGVDPVW
jgi:hypothetical protein